MRSFVILHSIICHVNVLVVRARLLCSVIQPCAGAEVHRTR